MSHNATTYFIGDLHFNHANIITYSRTQFTTITEHNEALSDNWCSVVKPNDNVYLMGDIGMGQRELMWPIVKKLPGNKFLIMGNHDNKIPDYYNWTYECGITWSKGVHEYKRHVLLTHMPVHPCQQDRYKLNIHGHMHNSKVKRIKEIRDNSYIDEIEIIEEDDPFYFNVCAEHINYTPISWQQIKEQIRW